MGRRIAMIVLTTLLGCGCGTGLTTRVPAAASAVLEGSSDRPVQAAPSASPSTSVESLSATATADESPSEAEASTVAATDPATTYVPTCAGLEVDLDWWTPYCGDAGMSLDLTWDKRTSHRAQAHGELSWHFGSVGPTGTLRAQIVFDEPEAPPELRGTIVYSRAVITYYGMAGPNGYGRDVFPLEEVWQDAALRGDFLDPCPFAADIAAACTDTDPADIPDQASASASA